MPAKQKQAKINIFDTIPNMKPVLYVSSILIIALGVMMIIPILVGWALNSQNDIKTFAIAATITLFFGTALALITREKYQPLSIRQAFILTSLSWIILVAFAAIPFCLSQIKLSYTDAFFEAMSGLTTTGATVITGLNSLPPGLLIWRGILQWIGGIGIIVTSVAVLPMLRIGGMQLFRMESFR